jgi:Raf kinase inhibitor-like YbhB/YbcL family protein
MSVAMHRPLVALVAAGLIGGSYLAWTRSARAVDHPDLFELTSPDFADNGMLSEDNAYEGQSVRGPWDCGGKNISPALSWSRAPADTKSFAIVMEDPDAASGRGGTHWITFDIPPAVTAVERGDANKPGKFGAGNPGRGKAYHGPCAEPGGKAHHFVFMVYALDLGLGVLPAGMDRAQFVEKIRGHNVAAASFVARYERTLDGKVARTSH